MRAAMVALLLILGGCHASSTVVENAPPDWGLAEELDLPAQQVANVVPRAVQTAGLSVVKSAHPSPATWMWVAELTAGWGGDGQWSRVLVTDLGNQRTLITVYSAKKVVENVGESPMGTQRNIRLAVLASVPDGGA